MEVDNLLYHRFRDASYKRINKRCILLWCALINLCIITAYLLFNDRFIGCLLTIFYGLIEQREHLYRNMYTVYFYLERLYMCTDCCIHLYRLPVGLYRLSKSRYGQMYLRDTAC